MAERFSVGLEFRSLGANKLDEALRKMRTLETAGRRGVDVRVQGSGLERLRRGVGDVTRRLSQPFRVRVDTREARDSVQRLRREAERPIQLQYQASRGRVQPRGPDGRFLPRGAQPTDGGQPRTVPVVPPLGGGGGGGGGLGALGRTFGYLGAGLALDKVARDAATLDTNLRRLGTVGGDVEELNKRLGLLSQELGGVANKSELAEASYQALSAGFTTSAANISVVEAATKAAVGGLVDTASVVEVLSKTLNAYNLSAGQATQVTDSISKAIEVGQVQWSDYTTQLGRVASVAALAGVSLDEVNAFIAASTKNGATAEVAFTGIGAALATLLKPTEESVKAAEELGIQWNLTGLQTKGFAGLLEQLGKAQETNQGAAARLLGSQEALRGTFAATSKGGKDFAAALDAISDASGKTDKDFDRLSKSLGNQFKTVDTALRDLGEALATAFGPTALEILQETAQTLRVLAAGVSAIPQPVADAAGKVAMLAAKLFLLQKALQGITALRGAIAATLATTANGLRTSGAAAAAATPKLAAAKAVLTSLARLGIVVVGVEVVTRGIEKLDQLQQRLAGIGATGTQEFGESLGGTALSRSEIAEKLEENTAEQERLRKELGNIRFPLLTGKDEELRARLLELQTREAKLGTMRDRARFATPAEREAADAARAGATPPGAGADGAGAGAGAASDDRRRQEQLARNQQRLDQQRNDNALRLDEARFQAQLGYDRRLFDLQEQFDRRREELAVLQTPAGPAREQMQFAVELMQGRRELTSGIRDLELQIKELDAGIDRLRNAPALMTMGESPVAAAAGGLRPGMSKSELRAYLESQGYVRTDTPYTSHRTPNHFHNAMDMALPYNAANERKMAQMEAALRAAGYGNVLGPTSDPGGHYHHLHIPTPGGQTINGPAGGGAAPMVDQAGMLARGGDIQSMMANREGLQRQLQLMRQFGEEVEGIDWNTFIQKSVNAFDDQTEALKTSTQELQNRNRLALEGFSENEIDRIARLTAVNDDLGKRLEVINWLQREKALSAEEAADATDKLTKAAKRQAEAVSDDADAQLRGQAASSISQGRNSIIDLQAQRDALFSRGTVQLTAEEQAMVRIKQLNLDVNDAYAQKMLLQGRTIDGLTREIQERQRIVELVQQVGSTLEQGLTRGIEAAITGAESLQQVLSDVLRDMGRLFLQAGIRGALGGIEIGGIPLIPGRASGGDVTGGRPYFVGEEGRELFVPGISGTVLDAGDTQAAVAGAMGNMTGGGDASDESLPDGVAAGERLAREFSTTRSHTTTAINNMQERSVERERQQLVGGPGGGGDGGAIKLETRVINGVEYATVEQVRAAATRAEKQGAARARAAHLKDMRNSPSYRGQNR